MRLASLALTAALSLLLAVVPGCSCSAPTLGASCTQDSNCNGGELCNPVTMRCELAARPDSAGYDSGTVTDDAPGLDAPLAPGDDAFTPDLDASVTDAAPICNDADRDGVTDCAGDCDDADPLTYPGATEVCGDGVRNDCTAATADAGCGGIGTYVARPPLGSPSNPGTQAAPVDTIAQGIMNAVTIGGGVDVYVAVGSYVEDVTMVEGVSVLGGHESTGWTRDPLANVTVIEAAGPAGVTFPAGTTGVTELDGFTVRGRSGVSASAGVTFANGSSGTVSDCVVEAGNVSSASYGVHVNPMDMPNTGTPLVRDTEIRIGTSGGGWGGGNGGWGVRSRRTATRVERAHVYLANGAAVQRGIEILTSPTGASVTGSIVEGTGTTTVGFGIRIAGGAGLVDDNVVWPGRCTDTCIGIALEGAISVAVVTNNVAFGGEGAMRQSGLSIAFEGLPPTVPDILVHSNFLDGGTGATMRACGVYLGERPSMPLVVGRIMSNVIRSGTGATRFAIFEEHANIDPMGLANNALHYDSSGSGSGGLYRDEGAMTLSTLAAVNALGGASMNLDDACAIVNPVPMGDYHLGAGSACIDAGLPAGAPTLDFEGDTRDATPDIGPDET